MLAGAAVLYGTPGVSCDGVCDAGPFCQLREQVLAGGGAVEVELQVTSAGRGLAAARALQRGELALRVPLPMTLGWDTIDADVLGVVDATTRHFYLEAHGDGEGRLPNWAEQAELAARSAVEEIVIAVGLLEARRVGGASPFAAYLASLPSEPPPNYPYWPEAWRRALDPLRQGISLRSDFAAKAAIIGRVGEQLWGSTAALPEEDADIRWAMSMHLSRSVAGRMVPLVDFANHAFEANAALGCDEDLGACYVRATQPVRAGEQLLVTYFERSDVHLLASFGFQAGDANPFALVSAPWPWPPERSPAAGGNCSGLDLGSEELTLRLDAAKGIWLGTDVVHCLRDIASGDNEDQTRLAAGYVLGACRSWRERLLRSQRILQEAGDESGAFPVALASTSAAINRCLAVALPGAEEGNGPRGSGECAAGSPVASVTGGAR